MKTYALWICDSCGDHAEDEPGTECEVCCAGVVQSVQVIPAAEARRQVKALCRIVDAFAGYEAAPWDERDDQWESLCAAIRDGYLEVASEFSKRPVPASTPEPQTGTSAQIEYGRNFREAMERIEALPASERAAASNRSSSSSTPEPQTGTPAQSPTPGGES